MGRDPTPTAHEIVSQRGPTKIGPARSYVATRVAASRTQRAFASQERGRAVPRVTVIEPRADGTARTFEVYLPEGSSSAYRTTVGLDITADPVTGDFALGWITNDRTDDITERDLFFARVPRCLLTAP